MSVRVTTTTITSITDDDRTWAITSTVRESIDSALDHLREMGKVMTSEPFYMVSDAGWRWTWEYVNTSGHRCSDTVRITP